MINRKKIIVIILIVLSILLIFGGIIANFKTTNNETEKKNNLKEQTIIKNDNVIIESDYLSMKHYIDNKISFSGVVLCKRDDGSLYLSIYVSNISENNVDEMNIKLTGLDDKNNELDSVNIKTEALNIGDSYTTSVDVSEKFSKLAYYNAITYNID